MTVSLKAFHVFFISTAVLLCLGFGGWCLNAGYRISGLGSFGFGALLVAYEIVFLRKFKEKK